MRVLACVLYRRGVSRAMLQGRRYIYIAVNFLRKHCNNPLSAVGPSQKSADVRVCLLERFERRDSSAAAPARRAHSKHHHRSSMLVRARRAYAWARNFLNASRREKATESMHQNSLQPCRRQASHRPCGALQFATNGCRSRRRAEGRSLGFRLANGIAPGQSNSLDMHRH